MNWYENQKERWAEIIKIVATEENRSVQMVEKDTIQSIFLLKLSYSELPFVFKGGTSLSKVYDLINRFSEDIDLSMSRKITESEKKSASYIVNHIAKVLGLFLLMKEILCRDTVIINMFLSMSLCLVIFRRKL